MHPSAHPTMLQSQKACKGEEKKATGPRKAVSHLCSRFDDWLQRESVLEARKFFPDRSPYPVMYGQGSFTMKHMMTKSHRGQCA